MSINKNKFKQNVLQVMTSRGIMLVSEILLGFVVPKILGVTGYGYLKTYSLYTAYTALLHFGFVDGILLKFAGQNYEDLDKKKIRTLSMFFIEMQIVIGILLLLICKFFVPSELKFIGYMLSINTFVINLTSYYQYISQATQRFKELSTRNILIAICKILLVCCLVLVYKNTGNYVSYKLYIVFINIIEFSLMLWYVITYRDITFGRKEKLVDCKNLIAGCFRNGFALTIAYQVSHLVFMLDRQFVSILYTAETFAIYSFAYSLVSVCTKIISTLSTVLFPMLKQMSEESALKYFSDSISMMLILSGLVLTGYYPLTWFIKFFLPAYVDSLIYLRVILPALLLSCCISVLMFTFYKVINKNMIYFKISCIVFVISIINNFIAHILFGSAQAISWASTITMLIWFILAESYFIKNYHVKWKQNLIYACVIMICFYGISYFNGPWLLQAVVYFLVYFVITILWYRKTLLSNKLLKRK
ncbi:oligosaccharide flippase family protein [Floccifex sp.]|uniref:oligosaccharide flippase family protein n=1 Tax=Floccifex sp. TaxID=2815810 RepID=UPI002A75C883|nr:oligosaccharide flippase family protein [Floccifex sp.]MDD7282123.1 oligosaccharide flippase family protein [Erysipelotrichaceae bacterium]MDY2957452.1 oligosaccharide flippase family protein [Floccifex sp.]